MYSYIITLLTDMANILNIFNEHKLVYKYIYKLCEEILRIKEFTYN